MKYWLGTITHCDLCKEPLQGTMHDARTMRGWANICHACFVDEDCKTGTGNGQTYRKQPDGRWLKVAG